MERNTAHSENYDSVSIAPYEYYVKVAMLGLLNVLKNQRKACVFVCVCAIPEVPTPRGSVK